MRTATVFGYRLYFRHLVMLVLIVLLILSNFIDGYVIENWDFTWTERKTAETVFVILGALVIVPLLYRRYFLEQDEEGDD